MEVRLLGVTEILGATGPLPLPSGRGRALLAILALQAGRPVAVDRLIDELWGGTPPATAATVIHGLVSRLRRGLDQGNRPGHRAIETVGKGYRLAVDPNAVDALRFERLLEQARGTDAATRVRILSAAVALWRGSALADFTYEPFAQRTIRALEESRIQAEEDLLEAELNLGRADQVVPRIHDLIEAHPFRERLHGLLMTALYRSGRQADALAAYQTARELLREELGVAPGPALESMHGAILRQDSSLDEPAHRLGPAQQPRRPATLTRERRRVTVAVVDVSPDAEDSADAETLARAGSEAGNVAADLFRSHGGRVERSLGDELVAFFGFPTSHEDDALRALRAVVEVRTKLASGDLAPGVRRRVRAGIETGDIVITGPAGPLPDVVAGPVISTARHLALAGSDSDILLGSRTVRLVSGAAKVEPVDTAGGWLLRQLAPPSTQPRTPGTPMVGREAELAWLRAAFRRTVRAGTPVPIGVVGDAGIGKSRLASELVASLGPDVHAIVLRCAPPHDSLGFYPVRQAIVQAAGLHGWRWLHSLLETGSERASVVDEVAACIGLRCPPATADELEPPMRRLLHVLAGRGPLVVVLDDVHWAPPAFLELIGRLEHLPNGVLLMCLRRPGPADDMASSEPPNVLRLGRLSDADVGRLVVGVGGPVTPGALHRVVELAQGNPLYAEQLLAAASQGELDPIPASLVGLLSMRLDQLGPGEREVLRCASVAGLDIDADAVRDLLPPEAGPFVAHHLDALVRKRFIDSGPGNGLRFAHALLQMAAYQSLTLADRALLREKYQARASRHASSAAAAPAPAAAAAEA